MKQLNQRGFTLIEGLLIIIAIAIVGGVGFYVVNANKDKKDQPNSSSSVQQTSTDTSNNTTQSKAYLEIKEFGIKLEQNDFLKNISYKLNSASGAEFKIYDFSDTTISEKVNACIKTDQKYTDGYRLYQTFKADGQFSPNREAGNTNILLKQFDTFYIAAIGQPNFSPCLDASGTSVDNAQLVKEIEAAQIKLSEAFSSAEKL